MRIDVKKFLFGGPLSEKETFFKKAQELGIIHFINMDTKILKEVPQDVNNISMAIKILSGLPSTEQEEIEDYALADEEALKILQLKQKLEKNAEIIRILNLDIERVRIYGNFSKEDIDYIEKAGDRKIQFFYAKQGFSQNPDLPSELIFIGSEYNLDYFLAVNKEPKSYERMVEMQINEPFQVLVEKRDELVIKTENLENQLKEYAKYKSFLQHAIINKLNEYHLQAATSAVQSEMNGELYFTTGFVPLDKIDEMNDLTSVLSVYVEEIAIESQDVIPTYLKNEGTNRIGEDLVHIYDTPSSTDKDPSIWVLGAFTLFSR